MSEEGRTAPVQKALDAGESRPELTPPSSVTELTLDHEEIRSGGLVQRPSTAGGAGPLLAPVAGLPVDDEDGIAVPDASGASASQRPRARLSLRIPDDEVTRPTRKETTSNVPPSPSAKPRPTSPSFPPPVAPSGPPPSSSVAPPPRVAPSSPLPPPRPRSTSIPVPTLVEPVKEVDPNRFDADSADDEAFEAETPALPAVMVMPMRIIALDPLPEEEKQWSDPPPSITAVEEEGEDIRWDDETPAQDRRSEPGDEISVDEVVEESPKAPRVDAPRLPPMRARATSTPPPVPPPTKRPAVPVVASTAPAAPAALPTPPVAAAKSQAEPAPPASKPPVIVPPHVGIIAPQQAESSGLRRKGRLWWEELFNDDYLRTVEKLTDAQVLREVNFIEDRLGIERGGSLLDLACGTGRHAVELASRGYEVVGFDLSLAMLAKAGDEAQDRAVKINFVQGDMREMTFEEQFDGVYCWGTSFGYFEEEKNVLVIERVRRALRTGGLVLLDVVNRDFLVRQSPSLAWFEGDGCVCMDEMSVDFITSRMKVKRTMMLDDGRSREIEYSMRVYSLHELGKILHDTGFKVCEVSGRIATPGVFFGNESPRTIVVAEKR